MPDPVAVLVDYAGQRRAASFSAWPASLTRRCHLLTGAGDGELPSDLKSYVDTLADRVGPARPRYVMAYCLATGIAQELARELVARGQPPATLVAFDPTHCEPRDFTVAFAEIVAQVATGPRVEPPTIDDQQLLDDPQRAFQQVERDLRDLAAAALGRPATPGDRLVDALVQRCTRWLRYLTLAISSGWPDWGGDIIVFRSRDHDPGPLWPGRHPTVVPVDATPEDLLTAPDVLARVERLLAVDAT